MPYGARITRSLVVVIAAIAVVAAVILGVGPTRAQNPQPLSVDRRITPERGILEQGEFTVTLTLTGNSAVCPQRVSSVPSDIVLVIDHSASMYETGGEKMAALKAAANDFIGRVDLGQARVGIVEFDDDASIIQELTDNRDLLRQAIEGIQPGGTTAIDLGVEFAVRELTSDRARQGVQPVIVLLTDGIQTSSSGLVGEESLPVKKAREAQSRGIRVITIGLGQDAAQDVLQIMAAQPTDYYFAPTPDQLGEVYRRIAQSVVQPAAATDAVVEHTFDASAFEVLPDSISDNGVVNGDKIVWSVANVSDAPIELSYRTRPRALGTLSADRGDVVRFNQCAETFQTVNVPSGLPVQVGGQPLTPDPAVTSGLALTPTLSLAAPTTPLTLPEQLQFVAINAVCDLNWIPLCLVLPLLLFFAWWLRRVLKRIRDKQPLCDLIPWLLVPLTLILAGFILNALGPALCAQESVYFWRISSGQANGRIFVTDPIGLRPAQEFSAVSPGQCTGCHSVSSNAGLIASVSGGGTGEVVVYTLDGRKLDVPQVIGAFSAWSPDGTKLAVSTLDNNIVILDIAGKTVTPLNGASDPNMLEAMPSWSADGRTIAFVRGGQAESPFRFTGTAEIFTVPASGGAAQPLPGASGSGFSYYPAYSPDGKWLAFTGHTSGATTYAAPEAEIFLVPAAGGDPIRLRANDADDGTALTGVSNSWATWSVDGRRLAFTSKRNDSAYDVFITTIDGNGNSGPAVPLRNAAQAGIFEHLPFWGTPPNVNVLPALLSLIPCLIPFLLVLLAWLLCRSRHQPRTIFPDQKVTPVPVSQRMPPGPLPAIASEPLWQVAPTLIIGIGGTGRWVLTHLKKTLRDGGGGTLPKDVRFVLLDTSEGEETNVFYDEENRVATVSFAGVSLEHDEMLLLNQNLSAVIQRTREDAAKDDALKGWFPYDEYRARLPLGAMALSAGTAGRRPMARAGLIERLRTASMSASANENANAQSDRLGNDAALLWQTLVEGSDRVKVGDGKLVRVVVVGSLAGGMSGVLFDLAYLARLAARQVIAANGTVTVEGYLATPGAFDHVSVGQNATRLQVNAAAASRELQRFQLSEGYSFPMRYAEQPALSLPKGPYGATATSSQTNDAQVPLDGTCDWMLFDHVTLFGGDGSPDRSPGKSNQPWATVFASMADVIGLRMDGATNAGAAGDYHAGLRNDIVTRQAREGAAVVSTAGSFVYRLPLLDILEIAQAQWARKLFHTFVNGSDPSGTTPGSTTSPSNFEVPEVEAGRPAPPEQSAQEFVSSQYEAEGAPRGMPAVGALAASGNPSTQDVLDLTIGEGEGTSFERYLSNALGLILNGRAGEADLSQRATGLDYAIEFASNIQTLLGTALQNAQLQQQAAPEGVGSRSFLQNLLKTVDVSKPDWDLVIVRLRRWVSVVRRSAASLKATRAALHGDGTEDGQPARGVLAELETRQARAEQRRKQMDQIAVRRYLWSRPSSTDADPSDPTNQVEIAESILRQVEETLPDYLKRFYWRMQPDGSVQLEVITNSEKPIGFKLDDPSSAQKVADEITRLAAHVVKNMAKDLALHDVLATQLPRTDDPAVALVEQAWRWAQPHLAYSRNVNGDLDGRRHAATGVPLGMQEHRDLSEVTKVVRTIGTPANRINLQYEPCPTAFVSATDRTAFTTVREFTLMPLFNLPEMQRAWDAYRRNAGTEVDRTTEGAVMATVFAAEHAALDFERRLESTDPTIVNIDFHALHPLVVLALARYDRAELYACAFAAGWVIQKDEAAQLALPDGRAFRLDLRERATVTAGLDWRIAGLLQFAAGDEADEAAAEALRSAFSNPNTVPRQAWQTYLRGFRSTSGPRPLEHEPQAVRDLAEVAALTAYRRLVPPEDREERWNRLVMRRARRA